jgi:hypothetical protein
MARYIVRFVKNVLGENGHEIEVCQSSVEVEAANEAGAVKLATTKFCENEHLQDWSLHADRVRVVEADFPS